MLVGCQATKNDIEKGSESEIFTVDENIEEYISKEDILSLLINASKAYRSVPERGEGIEGNVVKEDIVMIDGINYYKLGTAIDTISKLKNHLGIFFTEETQDIIIKQFDVKENDGYIYIRDGDLPYRSWEEASVNLVKMNKYVITVEITFQSEIDGIQFIDKYQLNLIQNDYGQWLIDTDKPHNLY